ncbi:MAG TPA: penicillin-binding protein activator LpoB [Verrucomicrobiota bacterium]|nr:penicillin-binding protein activator LpoB [Verrucomicrobiota bacterium]
MKTAVLLPFALAAAALALLPGCTRRAQYVDPKGSRVMTTIEQINIQDFAMAGEDAINSLLASGVLDQVPEKPAILVVSRVVNNTAQQVDTDLLTKRIRVALNQSGKALTQTTRGPGGVVEDELAREIQLEREALDGLRTRIPDFSLSGKIIETFTRSGSYRQAAYTFQLSLTDNRGLAVWEGEKQVVKQGRRPAVGF